MSDAPAQPVIPFIPPELAWMMALLSQAPSVPLPNGTVYPSFSQDIPGILPPSVVPTLDTCIQILYQVRNLFLWSGMTDTLSTQNAPETLPPMVPDLEEYIRMQSQRVESSTRPPTENGNNDQMHSQGAETSTAENESIRMPIPENIRSDRVQIEEAESSVTTTEVELYSASEDGGNDYQTQFEIAQIPLPPPVTEESDTSHNRVAHRKCQRCSKADHTWVDYGRRSCPYCRQESVSWTHIYGCGIRNGRPRSPYRSNTRRSSFSSVNRDREIEYKKSMWRRFPTSSSDIRRRTERSRTVGWQPKRAEYIRSNRYPRSVPYATRRWL